KFSGDWTDYHDFTARTTKKQLLIVGAGSDWTEFGGSDIIRTTADVQLETPSRWALYAALHGNVRRNDGDQNFDWGALAQAGYAITPVWEPFVRYDIVVIDNGGATAGATGQDAFDEFTIRLNYFPGKNGDLGHRGKFT